MHTIKASPVLTRLTMPVPHFPLRFTLLPGGGCFSQAFCGEKRIIPYIPKLRVRISLNFLADSTCWECWRLDCDDLLFFLGESGPRFAVVHLTYARETRPEWPITKLFDTLEAWIEQCMIPNALELGSRD